MKTHYHNPVHAERSLCGYWLQGRCYNSTTPMVVTNLIENVNCKVCLKKAAQQLTAKLKAEI